MDKKIILALGVAVLIIAALVWYCWNEPIRLTNEGMEKFNNNDWTGAITSFDAAINFQPYLNQGYLKTAYLHRGYAEYRTGDSAGAIKDMDNAIELPPNDPTVYEMKGYIEYKAGNTDGGKKDIIKGLLIEWPTIQANDPSIEMNVQGTIETLDYTMNK
jgi:outer membrane protein assembly factor BamD (BamD/ComL family)